MDLRRISFCCLALIGLVLAVPAHAQVTFNSVTLSWTTPGDDGTIGTATAFDLRYSTSPIDATNFDAATRWGSTPTPGAPGTHQTVTVTGLAPSTKYYFAIKTGDEVPNWAPISNLVSATTQSAPDLIRPAVLAISATGLTDTTATLSWTAVGDDSLTGTATSYDFRYSSSAITNSNWASATQATGEPIPQVAGTAQSFTVTGLTREGTYYFAAKVSDESGNVSALSNVPKVTTPDTMPPAAIRDLAVGWLYMGWRSMMAVRPRWNEGR